MFDKTTIADQHDLVRYFPIDPNGVWINSGELSLVEIASCQCVPDCWFVDSEGLGWAKIQKEVAIPKLAKAAYRVYERIAPQSDSMLSFEVLPEVIQQAWEGAIAHTLWQVKY